MIAAYIRVSTRQQDHAAQKRAISQAATARGDTVGRWFEEKKSAKTLDRPVLTELRAAVKRGEFRKLYVFRVDRLARSGIRDTLAVVDELRGHGCKLATVADAFDLDGPSGDVVLAVMAWAAQMERQALSDRISAARDRVEAAGGRWGRPRRIDPGALSRAHTLRCQGRTIRQVAAQLKIPWSTLQRALAGNGHYSAPEKIPTAEKTQKGARPQKRSVGQKKAVARET
jgi:DNA invertase Pin-like site-specific DNA recombinase